MNRKISILKIYFCLGLTESIFSLNEKMINANTNPTRFPNVFINSFPFGCDLLRERLAIFIRPVKDYLSMYNAPKVECL